MMHNDDNAAVSMFKVGAIGSLIILALVLLLGGCSGERPSHVETTVNADGSTNVCTVYDDNQTPRASCTIERK